MSVSAQVFQIGVKGLIRDNKGRILMVHLPKWSGNKAHWDLPGGRMDPGETPLETLRRELIEEIGTPFVGRPKQLMTFLTNITIPVDTVRLPLVFVVYKARIAKNSAIKLDPMSAEDAFKWFSPLEAAKNMEYKFSDEFCQLVAGL